MIDSVNKIEAYFKDVNIILDNCLDELDFYLEKATNEKQSFKLQKSSTDDNDNMRNSLILIKMEELRTRYQNLKIQRNEVTSLINEKLPPIENNLAAYLNPEL